MPLHHVSRCWSCDLPMCNDLRLWVCTACSRLSINVRLLLLLYYYYYYGIRIHVRPFYHTRHLTVLLIGPVSRVHFFKPLGSGILSYTRLSSLVLHKASSRIFFLLVHCSIVLYCTVLSNAKANYIFKKRKKKKKRRVMRHVRKTLSLESSIIIIFSLGLQ